MSRLQDEVRECMLDFTNAGEEEFKARFCFPRDFIGFQGHFREKPVLPAVCSIQAAVAAFSAWSGRRVRLSEIVTAKFSSPITYDEEIAVVYSLSAENERETVLKGKVTKDREVVGRFKLKVGFEDERARR